jgi:hypothetical protein
MDLIYYLAEITIIASHGTNANAGLPGVNDTARQWQPSVNLGDLSLLSTMQHPRCTIQQSVWHTRAWTLQEGVVSRRRLVFTNEQLYYECTGMNYRESIIYDLKLTHLSDKSRARACIRQGFFDGS